ncbi:hypothetical protein NAD41_002340 [Salmonella enterica]|nr:hypothetical protein [Salmonella enterica]EKK6596308.1 hypothetical protein [Salmonella enterica]
MKRLITSIILAVTLAVSAQASAAFHFNAGSEGRMVITDDTNTMMLIDQRNNKTRYHVIDSYHDIDNGGEAFLGTIYKADLNPNYAIIIKSYDDGTSMMVCVINGKMVLNQRITEY